MSAWTPSASFVPGPPPYDQVPIGQPKFPRHDLQQRDKREVSKTRIVNSMVPEMKEADGDQLLMMGLLKAFEAEGCYGLGSWGGTYCGM